MERELILNKSYGEFILNTPVIDYLINAKYKKKIYNERTYENECYIFEGGIELWCENGVVNTIRCDTTCWYKGHNLIGLNYATFLNLINSIPTEEDTIYLLLDNGKGQNQHVYEFEEEGLQVWVWRNKIRTVLIYNNNVYNAR